MSTMDRPAARLSYGFTLAVQAPLEDLAPGLGRPAR